MRYRVRRIGTGSFARQGAVAGALLALVPALAAAAGLKVAAHALRGTLEGWRTVRVGLPPVATNLNFVDLLHVTRLLAVLRQLDDNAFAIFMAVVVAGVALGALAGMMTCLFVALFYNLGAFSGGLIVDLEPAEDANGNRRAIHQG